MSDILLTNTSKETFIEHVNDSLNKCEAFYFSVSFIKKAGLVLLEKQIEDCLRRGKQGKIICSTYQNFTDISSLKKFKEWADNYPNFSCHLDIECFGDSGFHTKGYIFQYPDNYELIVGSSNITRFALLKNVEWNVSIIKNDKFESYNQALDSFDELWNKTLQLDDDLIQRYSLMLEYAVEKWDMDYCDYDGETVTPNNMQKKALKELRRYRDLGTVRALIVAATGSGKTYLAAFDALNFGSKRLLYICHRDVILSEAMDSFKDVFKTSRTYGFYNGKEQDLNADFIFASTTMLVNHINDFNKKEFDYIVYDEAHHIMADGGQKIFSYFDPDFFLGLTATPDRMDNKDVVGLFEHNVPFELQLRDAIKNDLVVPFHYYGIRDELVTFGTGKALGAIAVQMSDPNNIDFIDREIKKYQKPNEKLKAIAFCIDLNHSKRMAEEFVSKGYSAIALNGSNNTGQRLKAFKDLQDENNPLQIICAVDILNEGVDIPAINMVLFLRPTESPVIFLQQLGRGLRKYEGKDYLTVLDFIGNDYKRSIQIAAALGTLGKTTYQEKSLLMSMVRENFRSLDLYGVEIHIDELSKKEILDSISSTNLSTLSILKTDYDNFKKYLQVDTYPKHMDYLNSELAPDLMRFIKSKANSGGNSGKNKSYYMFLKKVGESNLPKFDEKELSVINSLSELLPITRLDEYVIVKQLIENNNVLEIDKLLADRVTNETLKNALHYLEIDKILHNGRINCDRITSDFKEYMLDLLNYGINRYNAEFSDYEGQFKLYGNYYKNQIMRNILQENELFQKGTRFFDDGSTFVFVCINKNEAKNGHLLYKDRFLDNRTFQWESENGTTDTNATGRKIYATKTVHLFVRKMESEDGITLPFTYFGTGKFKNIRNSSNNGKPTLLTEIALDEEIDRVYNLDFQIPKVCAAIIEKDDKIFVAQRGSGDFKGGWEFPGGKIEKGETSRDALAREIKEELNTEIEVGEYFDTIDYYYPKFHLVMACYFCKVKNGNLSLLEHQDSKWVTYDELDNVDWLAADKTIIDELKNRKKH